LAPAVDLAPLTDLIADLHRENTRLTEAAAVWQVRAMQAEDRLKQITAGAGAPQDVTEATPAAPVTVSALAPTPPWWRRLWERR